QLQNAYPVAQCRQNSGMNIPHGRTFTTNREEPPKPRFGALRGDLVVGKGGDACESLGVKPHEKA
ncbi:hypothetical protein, partial [Pseudarthrobacter oxydans]|uniref:hypothetical protein n=1 Tax=Pseudarthrobacter oxydans TaxID=1671 RepID=UPI00344EF10E